MNKKDIGNSSFAYSVSLLKMLLAMQLITEDEYERIAQISANITVLILFMSEILILKFLQKTAGSIRTIVVLCVVPKGE